MIENFEAIKYTDNEVRNVEWMQKLLNESFVKKAALFMQYICYLIITIMTLSLVLSCMGRLTFSLHTNSGTFEHAIYAEENHAPHDRSITIHTNDDIHVWTNEDDKIDMLTHIGLSVMFGIQTVPIMIAYWLLSCVFANICKKKIFTETNVYYLLGFGLLQFVVAAVVPFIKLLLCALMNFISSNRIAIATGQDSLNALIPSIALIVMAYIIHYGIHLQDEVDHIL